MAAITTTRIDLLKRIQPDETASVFVADASEVGLAADFIGRLGNANLLPVVDGSRLYVYLSETGVWTLVDRNEALGVIATLYAGASTVGRKVGRPKNLTLTLGETAATLEDSDLAQKRVTLTNQKILGIYAIATRQAAVYKDPQAFFRQDRPTIATASGHIALVEMTGGWGLEACENNPGSKTRALYPSRWEPECDYSEWEGFLVDNLFRDDDDRVQKAELLQEFVGACLFGVAPRFEKILLCSGGGANGKSTLLGAITALFPDELRSDLAPHALKREDYLAALDGAHLNCAEEISDAELAGVDKFKAVITGDTIVARELYGKPFSFVPKAGHIFACNRLPKIKDNSNGFWRRVLVLKFNRAYTGKDKDASKQDLQHKWAVDEKDQVFAWAVYGALRLLEQGAYTLAPSATAEANQWREEDSSIAAFFSSGRYAPGDETCGEWVRATDLYLRYSATVKALGFRPDPQTEFGRALVERGFAKRRDSWGYLYLIRDARYIGTSAENSNAQ